MQYAILADIHANLAALKAVMEDIQLCGGVDRICCLGDVVGYGPNPHECIQIIRSFHPVCVAGNHDRAVSGKISLSHFSEDAGSVVEWTIRQLSEADFAFLDGLPDVIVEGKFTLVHGSPRNPVLEYINSTSLAEMNFGCFETDYCLCAHTHEPMVYAMEPDGLTMTAKFTEFVKIVTGQNRLIINVGSVGQPRDGDPRAGYVIYDDETNVMRLRRVEYDIEDTESRIMSAGLPIRVAGRLSLGR